MEKSFVSMTKSPWLSLHGTTAVPIHSLRHSWHHVNQIASTTIHHGILWPIREKLCQNRKHRTSNSHRTEFEENSLMMDPVKSNTRVDLNNPSLLPLSNAMHSMKRETPTEGHHKCQNLWVLGNWVMGGLSNHQEVMSMALQNVELIQQYACTWAWKQQNESSDSAGCYYNYFFIEWIRTN